MLLQQHLAQRLLHLSEQEVSIAFLWEKLLLLLLLQLHVAHGLQQSNKVLDFEHLFVVPWAISQCYLPETSKRRFDFF